MALSLASPPSPRASHARMRYYSKGCRYPLGGRYLREKFGLYSPLPREGLVAWSDPSYHRKNILSIRLRWVRRLILEIQGSLGPFESSLGPSQVLWDYRLPRLD